MPSELESENQRTCVAFVPENAGPSLPGRMAFLWDAKLKVAPYDKQNAGTGVRGEGPDKGYELHSSVD